MSTSRHQHPLDFSPRGRGISNASSAGRRSRRGSVVSVADSVVDLEDGMGGFDDTYEASSNVSGSENIPDVSIKKLDLLVDRGYSRELAAMALRNAGDDLIEVWLADAAHI